MPQQEDCLFYVLHFLFIIVETLTTSTFTILHSCQGTTNSRTFFMDPGLAYYAFNYISFYSFTTYASSYMDQSC